MKKIIMKLESYNNTKHCLVTEGKNSVYVGDGRRGGNLSPKPRNWEKSELISHTVEPQRPYSGAYCRGGDCEGLIFWRMELGLHNFHGIG